MRSAMTASASWRRARNRCSSASNDGGITNTDLAAGNWRRTARAPCQSISKIACLPREISASIASAEVP